MHEMRPDEPAVDLQRLVFDSLSTLNFISHMNSNNERIRLVPK